VSVVKLRMPFEVISEISYVEDSGGGVPVCVISVDGPDVTTARLHARQLRSRLDELARSIREWVFTRAGSQTVTLRIARADSVDEIPLPPNVSVRDILTVLRDELPPASDDEPDVVDLR